MAIISGKALKYAMQVLRGKSGHFSRVDVQGFIAAAYTAGQRSKSVKKLQKSK